MKACVSSRREDCSASSQSLCSEAETKFMWQASSELHLLTVV